MSDSGIDYFRIHAQESLGLDPISCSGKQIREHSKIMYDLIEEDKWKTALAYGKDQGWFIEIWFWSKDKTSHWRLIDLKDSYRTIYEAYQDNDIIAMKDLAKIEQLSIEIRFQNQAQLEYNNLLSRVLQMSSDPDKYLQKMNNEI